jgi:hypothetical protein
MLRTSFRREKTKVTQGENLSPPHSRLFGTARSMLKASRRVRYGADRSGRFFRCGLGSGHDPEALPGLRRD